jgi:hypothetical protein
VNNVVVGFAAGGRDGNADVSDRVAPGARAPRWELDRDVGCDVSGDGAVDAPTHGVVDGRDVRFDDDDDGAAAAFLDSDGKRLVVGVVPQLAVRLTDDRDDCAVDDLSLSTRFPP